MFYQSFCVLVERNMSIFLFFFLIQSYFIPHTYTRAHTHIHTRSGARAHTHTHTYIYIYIYIYIYGRAIGLMSKVFTNGPGDRSSIPGRVIPKTQKMVPDASLLSTQHYKVKIKGKVEQSWKWSSAFPYTSV